MTLEEKRKLGRFGALLVTLVSTFVVAPFFRDEAVGVSSLSVVFTAVLLAGAYAVSLRRRVFYVGLAIGIPAIALEWISNFVLTTPLVIANLVTFGVFVLYVAAVVFNEILEEDHVTLDTIFGGICIYLMLGIAWVMAYAALEYWQPGSFLVGGMALQELHPELQVRFPEFLYFSFVTITTLGYGDIVPQTPPARAASTAEAIVGQLYIAIFVARLVGLYIVSKRPS
jgi:hypothetical protein